LNRRDKLAAFVGLDDFEKGENGDIILKPIMGWTSAPVADIAVLLAIEYAKKPEDIETGGKSIQFVLTLQQCLNLAEGSVKHYFGKFWKLATD
jgi:hypothetical protein